MKTKLPANRAAALGGTAAAVATAVVSVLGAVDSTSKAIVVSVALLVFGAVVCVFLLGSQKHEARERPSTYDARAQHDKHRQQMIDIQAKQLARANTAATSGTVASVTFSSAAAGPPEEPDAIDLGPDT